MIPKCLNTLLIIFHVTKLCHMAILSNGHFGGLGPLTLKLIGDDLMEL